MLFTFVYLFFLFSALGFFKGYRNVLNFDSTFFMDYSLEDMISRVFLWSSIFFYQPSYSYHTTFI